jgi:osmotically-inducible protein OsmY
MKDDGALKDEVEAALRREPSTAGSVLQVGARDGEVSLFGEVRSYAARLTVEALARRVDGVRSVTLGVTVHPSEDGRRTDAGLADSVRFALRRNARVPSTVRAKVERGWVTLQGEVTRIAQREAAERAVGWLEGVLGVTNGVRVEAQCSAAEAAEMLRALFARRPVRAAEALGQRNPTERNERWDRC